MWREVVGVEVVTDSKYLTPLLLPYLYILAVRSRFSPLCFSSVVKLSEDVPASGLWRPADGAPVSSAHQHRRASGAVWQEQRYSLPRGPQWVEHHVYMAQWATGKNIAYQLALDQIRLRILLTVVIWVY